MHLINTFSLGDFTYNFAVHMQQAYNKCTYDTVKLLCVNNQTYNFRSTYIGLLYMRQFVSYTCYKYNVSL